MERILFLISTPMLAIMFVFIYKAATATRKGERSLPYCIGIILSLMLVFLIDISGKTSIETVGEATVVDKLQESEGLYGSSYYLIVTDDSHEDRYAVHCSQSVYINHDVGDTVVVEIKHITMLFFIKSEITRVADNLETTPVPEPQSALIRRTST